MKSVNGTIELETHRYKLTEKLDFDAISYVWGTAAASVTITCNGRSLMITPTALEMLQYLHRYQMNTMNRKIWIDAICINQEDQEEKSTQIPLMRDIYSRAAAVIVWMGTSTPETDVFFAEFHDVRKRSSGWIALYTENPDCRGPVKEELPCDGEAFWGGLHQLFDNEWFRRLWTYQEIILSSTATILCGPSWADADEFLKFVEEGNRISNYILRTSRMKLSANKTAAINTCITIDHHRKHKPVYRLAGPIQTHNVAATLHRLRSRHVKEPVDRVWALVGLLKNDLRDSLASSVDYSAQGRNEYWRTWILFAKALLDEPGGLSLLQIPPTLETRSPYLPSWCPSLSGTPTTRMIIDGSWNDSIAPQHVTVRWALLEGDSGEKCLQRRRAITYHDKRYLKTVRHDNMLRIRGFVVDTVEEVVEHEKPLDYAYDVYDPDLEEHMTLYDTAVDCHLKSLDLARRVFYGKSEGITDIPEEFIMALFLDCRINEEAKKAYSEILSIMQTWYSDSTFRTWKRVLCHHQLTYMRGHTFFSTKGGRIGYAHPGCQPGDKVAAFYGGEALYILRQLDTSSDGSVPTGEASDHVQFLGAAFIPHLMEQHQRDAAHIGPDTTFFIH
jgi:hypothetical protein